MKTLADFLNHGILPFIGREVEIDRITAFWRGVYQATELRAMLLTGEAGVGKSRMLEQVTGRIVGAGGSVVHVKLYPEATASFLSLVARALWHPDAGRALLAEEPEGKLAPVGAALRRLARLRPTLIVLEDLHLLGADALPELTRLLKLLEDETISLLALARPVELVARGVLEPWLVEELVLAGLPREECARVWETISGSEIPPEIATALHGATAGNPLALRSALRGVLKGADVVKSPGAWKAATSTTAITRTLKRTVGLLAEGMTSDLNAVELDAARRLASLGEIFSREAAEAMLDDPEPMIEALLFKGIISTAVAAPSPLPGEPGEHDPLGFTHTLLHRHLVDTGAIDADALVRVIADKPLYSVLPFRLLADRQWVAATLDTATLIRAFDRTIKAQITIGQSAQWRATEQTWRTAARLLGSRLGSWERKDWERMLVKVIHHKLNLVRQESLEVRERWLNHLSLITDEPNTDELIMGRLFVLFHRDLVYSAKNPKLTEQLWNEAESLVGGRPDLQLTFAYTDYLVAAAVGAGLHGSLGMLHRISDRAEEILGSHALPTAVRKTFERKIRPLLLNLNRDQKEVEYHLKQVEEFEKSTEMGDASVWHYCITFLADVGIAGMLERISSTVIPLMLRRGMTTPAVGIIARRQRVLAGIQPGFQDLIYEYEHVDATLPVSTLVALQASLGLPIVDAALLRNVPEQAREIIERYSILDSQLTSLQQILLALHEKDISAALAASRSIIPTSGSALSDIIEALEEGDARFDSPELVTLLTTPVIRLTDILQKRAIAGLVDLIARERSVGQLPSEIIAALGTSLIHSLEWLGSPDRELYLYMQPVLDQASPYLNARQIKAWQKRIDELAAHHRQKAGSDDGRIRLSILGTIVARRGNEEPQRFQGARARALIGIMVADRMISESLSSADFARLVAGEETVEIENARNILKTTVHRVREALGSETILTDGQTPRFNPDLVSIDLLEAHQLLENAIGALRRSSPMQAKSAIIGALDITRGEVSFPSLYDSFIEAVREDFENKLRATAIDISRLLLREGGVDDAAEVLRRASDAIPGDPELAELLREALLQAGRHADAERVRRQPMDL